MYCSINFKYLPFLIYFLFSGAAIQTVHLSRGPLGTWVEGASFHFSANLGPLPALVQSFLFENWQAFLAKQIQLGKLRGQKDWLNHHKQDASIGRHPVYEGLKSFLPQQFSLFWKENGDRPAINLTIE